jgi:4-hydroxy-tetrahydrodipicolinate synthase
MKSYKGVITALATPFMDGDLDLVSFKKLLNSQFEAGVKSFVVNGTTAESPTLEKEEVKRLIDCAHAETNDDAAIIVGVGTNSTKDTIENAKQAESWGADALLVVVPYYNKPTSEGMFQHFKAVAEATKLPIVLYNVPGRTVVSLNAETVSRLAKIENIIAIKEASGDLELYKQIREQCPEEFLILSGDDDTWAEMAAQGGDGVISVISHLLAQPMISYFAAEQKTVSDAKSFNEKYQGLLKSVYSEPNPIGVKMALHKLGIFDSAELRLPMTTMTGTGSDDVEVQLKNLELLK